MSNKKRNPATFLGGWVSLILLSLMAFPSEAQANDELGIAVTVVSVANEQGLTEGNDSLWFPVEAGETYLREIEVESLTTIDQLIGVELFDYGFDNDQRFINFAEPSETSDWFSFGGEPVLLPAGETINLILSFSPPADAEERGFEGIARIYATAAEAVEDDESESGFRALVAGRAAIDIPFWLGIGDAISLVPEFDIRSIQGVLLDDTKYLRVFIDNTGLVPVRLDGSVQFADPVFVDRVYDPFVFRIPEIASETSDYVDVEIDQSITEGDWNILVAANQGPIRQSKLFEQNISFEAPNSGLNFGILSVQILASLGFLALAIVGYRLIRSSNSVDKTAKASKDSDVFNILRNFRYALFAVGNSLLAISNAIRKGIAKVLRAAARAIDPGAPHESPVSPILRADHKGRYEALEAASEHSARPDIKQTNSTRVSESKSPTKTTTAKKTTAPRSSKTSSAPSARAKTTSAGKTTTSRATTKKASSNSPAKKSSSSGAKKTQTTKKTSSGSRAGSK